MLARAQEGFRWRTRMGGITHTHTHTHKLATHTHTQAHTHAKHHTDTRKKNMKTLENMINLFLEASTGLELLRTLSSDSGDHMVSNFEEAEDGALSMHLSPQLPPGCASYQRS